MACVICVSIWACDVSLIFMFTYFSLLCLLCVAYSLVASPLVQGSALNSLLKFFQTIVASHAKQSTLQYQTIVISLSDVKLETMKSSLLARAHCIAGMSEMVNFSYGCCGVDRSHDR